MIEIWDLILYIFKLWWDVLFEWPVCACGIFMCFCLSARSNNFVGWVYTLSFSELQFKCISNPFCSWLSLKTSFDHSVCNWFHVVSQVDKAYLSNVFIVMISVDLLIGLRIRAFRGYFGCLIVQNQIGGFRIYNLFNYRHFFWFRSIWITSGSASLDSKTKNWLTSVRFE